MFNRYVYDLSIIGISFLHFLFKRNHNFPLLFFYKYFFYYSTKNRTIMNNEMIHHSSLYITK
eukprot:UN01878